MGRRGFGSIGGLNGRGSWWFVEMEVEREREREREVVLCVYYIIPKWDFPPGVDVYSAGKNRTSVFFCKKINDCLRYEGLGKIFIAAQDLEQEEDYLCNCGL